MKFILFPNPRINNLTPWLWKGKEYFKITQFQICIDILIIVHLMSDSSFADLKMWFYFSRIQFIRMGMLSLKMATTRHRLHLSPCMNPSPRVLQPFQPRLSRGSSGEGSMSSCSPASDTAWDWGTCGGSLTFVIVMEEVSSLKACSLSSEISDALNAWMYANNDLLHPFGQEALFALPLGVRCPLNPIGLFCTLCPEFSMATFCFEHKAFTNPLSGDTVFLDYTPEWRLSIPALCAVHLHLKSNMLMLDLLWSVIRSICMAEVV